MRYIAYRVIQVAMSVVAAVLCLQPLLLEKFPFDGEGNKEIIGVALLLLIPQIEIAIVTIANKDKASLIAIILALLWIGEIISFWSGGGQNLREILIIGAIISMIVSALISGFDEMQKPLKTPMSLIYACIIALLIWQYLRNQPKVNPTVTVGISLGYVIVTEWLLHSQKYLIVLDIFVGIGCWGIALMLWSGMNEQSIWADQRFYRVLVVMAAMVLTYYIYLVISEKVASKKKE